MSSLGSCACGQWFRAPGSFGTRDDLLLVAGRAVDDPLCTFVGDGQAHEFEKKALQIALFVRLLGRQRVPPVCSSNCAVFGFEPLGTTSGKYLALLRDDHRAISAAKCTEILAMATGAVAATGQLAQALSSDLLVGLYEAARDYKCVGGMLFPIFCFAYWPFLMLILLIAGVLPAQRVEDDALSLSQLRLQILLVISLLMAGVAGGVLWRSYSSHGLGELQW